MPAQVGDWLIAQSRTDRTHARRAEILAVHAGGEPPFTVRWIDDGHQAIVFPGPDAKVITAEESAELELDRSQSARIAATQSAITAKRSESAG